jgi:hypothetical protein
MPDVGALVSNLTDAVGTFFAVIGGWVQATQLPSQIKDVDYSGLFSNPWFLVPFVAMIVYMVYKQAFRDLIIVALIVGVWCISGMPYMQTLVVDGEVQLAKVLPVLLGAAGVLGFVIYLFFGRS